MKKVIDFIFVGILFVLMTLPLFFINTTETISSSENRELAKLPTLVKDNEINKELIGDFNNWLNDNIGFRELMIKTFNISIYKIFNKTMSEDVIIGKDDWLFYQGEKKIALKNYQNKKNYTEKQLKKILKNVKKLNSWCKQQGVEFILMLIPNKEYVYSEFLPNGIYEINETKNIDLVVNYIREHSDIKVVYPKNELLEMKNQGLVYYKYDTHWNELGGYVGYKALMDTLGNEDVISLENVKKVSKSTSSGDLGKLSMLNNKLPIYSEIHMEFDNEAMLIYDDKAGNNAYQIYENDLKSGSIFVMGDSFRTAMKPYLSRSFNKASFVHRRMNRFDEVKKEKPEVLVYEVVERYIPQLMESMDINE